MKTITIEQLLKELRSEESSFELINALEASRFEKMHIPGSRNIPFNQAIPSSLNKDDELVVYCTNSICYKSKSLYLKLKEQGYKVRRYEGGLMEWESKGLPLVGHCKASLIIAA